VNIFSNYFELLTKTVFTANTPKNTQNDRLYARPSTKKKVVATKRLRTQDVQSLILVDES